VTPVGRGGEVPVWLPDGLMPGAYRIGALEARGDPFGALSAALGNPGRALSGAGKWDRLAVTAN